MAFFEDLARVFKAQKQLKVQATKAGMLVNLPVAGNRRQTVKVTARTLPGGTTQVVAARVVSRAGYVEDHLLVRKALEFNAGKQRVSLILSGDSDPPALDVMLCIPIDLHDEGVANTIWRVMKEVATVADGLEKKLGSGDDL